ncbi:LOW QUALITY PROTEIN: protein phosphatase Slingshot homolog 3 [Chlamydotis macqueenii]
MGTGNVGTTTVVGDVSMRDAGTTIVTGHVGTTMGTGDVVTALGTGDVGTIVVMEDVGTATVMGDAGTTLGTGDMGATTVMGDEGATMGTGDVGATTVMGDKVPPWARGTGRGHHHEHSGGKKFGQGPHVTQPCPRPLRARERGPKPGWGTASAGSRRRAAARGGRWQVACGRAVLQELHRACEEASRGGHIPGGPALAWARGYAAALASEQSCLNEWLAMADLESVRPASPPPLRPATPELSEQAVRALLRDVMAGADLESVTSKEVREELERRTGRSLERHKDFIDNEMLLVLAQMDRPSRVFPHLYLGSEWNAANLEELQQNRVTHILNVAREIDNFFPALFTYMNVRVYDEEAAQLLPHWNDTFLFLSRVRAGGGRALVHCRMGLSRSAATVLAYAMKEFGWSLERALRHVRRCRPGVLPNPGFMRQLDFYQGILRASRHSSLWEPKAAERPAQPEEGPERPPGYEGDGLSPSPSPQPPEAASGAGLLGASRRPRISLCAVMRSISQLETPEPPEPLGEPLAGEVFAAAEAPGGAGDAPPGARPSSRPRRVVRQASLDGGPGPACDHAPAATTSDSASCPTPAPHPPLTPPPCPLTRGRGGGGMGQSTPHCHGNTGEGRSLCLRKAWHALPPHTHTACTLGVRGQRRPHLTPPPRTHRAPLPPLTAPALRIKRGNGCPWCACSCGAARQALPSVGARVNAQRRPLRAGRAELGSGAILCGGAHAGRELQPPASLARRWGCACVLGTFLVAMGIGRRLELAA